MINGAVAVVGMFIALMFGGFAGMWAIWPTAYRHGYAEGESDRHRHRRETPQETTLLELPRAGRLEPLPDLEPITTPVRQLNPSVWLFAGEWDQGPVAESAEYELLTQTAEHCPDCGREEDYCVCGPMPGELTAELPASVTGEPPIDTGELLAITDRVESWIAQWTAQGNIDRHTIQASDG